VSLRRSVLALALAVCAAGGLSAQTSSSTVTRNFPFSPIGFASSETAQINVVNLANNSSSGTAASCAGMISFLNSSGSAIVAATPFTVTSGQIFSAALPFAKTAASGRTTIRGLVSLTESTTSSNPPCELQVSMETFDTSTGVTHAYLAGGGLLIGGGPEFGH
jgi:hypothetical protein